MSESKKKMYWVIAIVAFAMIGVISLIVEGEGDSSPKDPLEQYGKFVVCDKTSKSQKLYFVDVDRSDGGFDASSPGGIEVYEFVNGNLICMREDLSVRKSYAISTILNENGRLIFRNEDLGRTYTITDFDKKSGEFIIDGKYFCFPYDSIDLENCEEWEGVWWSLPHTFVTPVFK